MFWNNKKYKMFVRLFRLSTAKLVLVANEANKPYLLLVKTDENMIIFDHLAQLKY